MMDWNAVLGIGIGAFIGTILGNVTYEIWKQMMSCGKAGNAQQNHLHADSVKGNLNIMPKQTITGKVGER